MYLNWQEKTLTSPTATDITTAYAAGFVFGRVEPFFMAQTRSMRIDVSKFSLSSENRRILRKTENISCEAQPLPYENYTWKIGKLGKDFYEEKFGPKTFSANKLKELFTNPAYHFNTVLTYTHIEAAEPIGYAICYKNENILHYSYPFYNLETAPKNMGMGMMLKAILYAQTAGCTYIYLGSAQRTTDTYKLQFSGLEWFDGKTWQTDQNALKEILQNIQYEK